MFGNFFKSEDKDRKFVRKHFADLSRRIEASDKMSQKVVGHAINMANSVFFKKFSSIENFKKVPREDQMRFLNGLATMQQGLYDGQDISAVGWELFKLWVSTLIENDNELEHPFAMKLAYFSKIGDIFGDIT